MIRAGRSERGSGAAPVRGARAQRPLPLAKLARLRQATYDLLSQAFLYPDQKRVQALSAAALALRRQGAPLARFAFYGEWQRLLGVLAGLARRELADLQREYVSLFVASPGGVPCPPYESVQRAWVGGATGRLVAAVEGEYAAAGLAASPELGERPDHVAVELGFLAVLCAREAQAWEEGRPGEALRALRQQRAFLERHLARWFPALVRQMAAADGGDTYPAIGASAQAYIVHDQDLAAELLRAFESIAAGVRADP